MSMYVFIDTGMCLCFTYMCTYVASGEGSHENLVAFMRTDLTYNQIPSEILEATVSFCVIYKYVCIHNYV